MQCEHSLSLCLQCPQLLLSVSQLLLVENLWSGGGWPGYWSLLEDSSPAIHNLDIVVNHLASLDDVSWTVPCLEVGESGARSGWSLIQSNNIGHLGVVSLIHQGGGIHHNSFDLRFKPSLLCCSIYSLLEDAVAVDVAVLALHLTIG